ncbi:MAG TPA: aquaporin [Candidatus Saccharimonadales bacterium]|nr:aquaporin [Candidatus Saccharimonadales bacterium]
MPKTKASAKSKPSGKSTPSQAHTATKHQSAPKRIGTARSFLERFNTNIAIGSLFAELVGTFGLTALVLSTNGNPVVAAVAVMIFVIVFGKLSGAHINPAVTIALLTVRRISALRGAGYIVAQLIGSMLALIVIAQFASAAPPVVNPETDQLITRSVFEVPALVGTWTPFFAEMLGSLILGLGIAAVTFVKREGLESGFAVGGALMLGLFLAMQGSAAVLNPAVALGLDAFTSDLWTYSVYAFAPVIGVTAGVMLFRLLQLDVKEETKSA